MIMMIFCLSIFNDNDRRYVPVQKLLVIIFFLKELFISFFQFSTEQLHNDKLISIFLLLIIDV